MFFVLQKMIWFLLLPPASLLVLIVVGLMLLGKRPVAGKTCIISGVVLLYLLSLAPIADLVLRPLEGRYPLFSSHAVAVDGVVVPGGGSVDLDWMNSSAEPNAETLARLVTGVELAKRFDVPLILCGGNGEPFSTRLRDADVMATTALKMGFPASRMLVENESRNTLENSHAVRRIFPGKRVILATSAYYMRRAVALFERRGFMVIPAPVYFLSQTRKTNLSSLVPGAGNLARSSTGIAEWLGMAWWHLRGEI
jgi:uncharacterized SAM-binding protein YcdF (DUF218 family)